MNINKDIFKEYDIRGVYPTEINEEAAFIIGKGYGSYLREKLDQKACVVGRDNRLSSPALLDNLIKGILSSGLDVINYGLITTPMHYLTRHINNLFGIMTTASHNPKDDNGFKFSFDNLANARGDMIYNFRDYVLKGEFLEGNGSLIEKNIEDEYLAYMKKNINMGSRKIKAVIDMGNGATTCIAKKIHSLFSNIEPIYICEESDGTFPNHHPDPAVPENMEMLKKKVLEEKADIGIAYDGDGDRVGVILENGEYISADMFMIIIVRDLFKKIDNKEILYDVKCSKSLEDEIKHLNGKPYIYRTGASYTEAKTKELNLAFGGEFSGHIFFNDRDYAIGSGIYAGLRLIEILSKTDKKASELLVGINNYFSTPEIKIPVDNTKKFIVVEKVLEYVKNKNYEYNDIDGVRVTFDLGWGLIRASNTGPNLTLRFEAKTDEFKEKLKKEFMDIINMYL